MASTSSCAGLSRYRFPGWHSSREVRWCLGSRRLGSRRLGVGAVGEQSPDAGGPAVARRGVQGQPLPLGVGLVDRGSGVDELVDDVRPLVIGGEH